MIRPLVSIVAGALAFAAVADLREVPVAEAERAEFSEACQYYGMRAAAVSAVRRGEFVVFLSDACAVAETLLESGTREQRIHSALLLSRIALLRQTVVQMNARRARVSFDMPEHQTAEYLPVSPAGEFLIARRLGVLLAFDTWLDSGAQFSIASYP